MKNILLTIGVTLIIILVIVELTSLGESQDNTLQPQTQSQDLFNHHLSQVANEETFNLLLGKEAPDFTLESYDGEQINLGTLKGKKIVLFFTEGLMCYPSCWNQIAAFAKDPEFNNSETVTLTITVDQKSEWRQAVEKMPDLSKTIVLFDSDRRVSSVYGVLTLPSSMHKGQFPGHTYLILDRQGVIRFIKDDPQMGVRNDELKIELKKIN